MLEDSIVASKIANTDPATFNFDGAWVCDIMTLEIKGDSGLFDVGSGRHWLKAEMDKSANPVGFDLVLNYGKKDKLYEFRSLIEIIDNNTLKIAFGKDFSGKPNLADLQNKENALILKRK